MVTLLRPATCGCALVIEHGGNPDWWGTGRLLRSHVFYRGTPDEETKTTGACREHAFVPFEDLFSVVGREQMTVNHAVAAFCAALGIEDEGEVLVVFNAERTGITIQRQLGATDTERRLARAAIEGRLRMAMGRVPPLAVGVL